MHQKTLSDTPLNMFAYIEKIFLVLMSDLHALPKYITNLCACTHFKHIKSYYKSSS